MVDNEHFVVDEGIDFLNSKSELLIEYLLGIQIYLLKKTVGSAIKDSALIKKLIYIKTLLQKMSPVEKKLEY